MRLASGRVDKYWANVNGKGAGCVGNEIGTKFIQFFTASDAMGRNDPSIRVESGSLESFLGRTGGPTTVS
eukprot:3063600-Alexandrium_andersonii.AAC.1